MKEIKWTKVQAGQSVKIKMAGRLRTIKKINEDYGEITADPRYPRTVGLKLYPTHMPGKIYKMPSRKPPKQTPKPKVKAKAKAKGKKK